MKKRLFLSSAIMTAVLAGALTTGTFAWYSAAQGGLSADANDTHTVLTKGTSEIGALTFDVAWTQGGGSTALGSDYFDNICLTDNEGVTKAWNAAHQLVVAQPSTGMVKSKQVRATISYAGTNENLAAVVGNYTATVQHGSDRLKLTTDNNEYQDETISFDFTISYDEGTSGYVISVTSVDFYVSVDGFNTADTWANAESSSTGVGGTLSLTIQAKNS